MNGLITSMFEIISEAITNFTSALGSAFTGITNLFYSAENGFTFLGTLALIATGVGLVYLAYRVIKKLISLRMG